MKKVCPECNQEYDSWWCKPCNLLHFENNFDKWTSGNETIDKFIQDAQLNTDIRGGKIIEWIPYDRFKDIKQIAKGGYATIYYAKRVDGFIIKQWDIENQQWKRYGQSEVVLKKFDNILDINEDFLNEMAIHLRTNVKNASVGLHGITKDPETHEYMIVLQYYKGGSLRNYLNNNFNNFNWFGKLYILSYLAVVMAKIHKLDIVHRDFHPGNILRYGKGDYFSVNISDFGLSKLITESKKNSQKNTISGVLPYIAPEVLIGGEYTKAADVYSFALVAYELITGLPPYHDVAHDKDLAFKICNGFRPKIPFHTPKLITQIIMRCWDARTTHRPKFEELDKVLTRYYNDYFEKKTTSEIKIQIKEAKEFSNQTSVTTPTNYKTHPQAIYTKLTASFYQINSSDDDDAIYI
ncbi:hypothetical protein Glove_109g84 [Diversispora epigaea]|uniref:Protein kinase domain-containing protein n=1 Tax=Diversispora epigaea TaxID=1348612 RepID=A0A397J733_9GLOM|nr:hypothetical protein Glove_109g84 [Diversispora epigaea]